MVAFLFPGQGAQVEGLLHQLPEHPEVTRTIEEASEALGLDIDALDSAEALCSTAVVQQALLIAGVVTALRSTMAATELMWRPRWPRSEIRRGQRLDAT